MKNKYLTKRKELLDKAKTAVDAGDLDTFNKLTADVEKLDADYEKTALAQANLDALNKKNSSVLRNFTDSKPVELWDDSDTDTSDYYNTVKYRKAFMNYVLHGKKSPELYNENANTTTTDVGAAIPSITLNRIIEKIEANGVILPLVTRTSYKGGVTIPTSNVKPVASWVNEGAGSARQKKPTGSITFAYHKLRCVVSVSLEVDTMALSAFESALINNVAEAMSKALEAAIINGDGSVSPKGILAETPVSGQAVELDSDTDLSYGVLCDCEAALPTQYESGAKWVMSKKTFMSFIGMVDGSGQPIARTNYGIGGKPERILLGRDVLISENMPNYTAAMESDTVIAFIFRMSDYVLNTNLDVRIKEYEDNDTDDVFRKAVMLVDGKVVDKNSLVTLTVKAASGSNNNDDEESNP